MALVFVNSSIAQSDSVEKKERNTNFGYSSNPPARVVEESKTSDSEKTENVIDESESNQTQTSNAFSAETKPRVFEKIVNPNEKRIPDAQRKRIFIATNQNRESGPPSDSLKNSPQDTRLAISSVSDMKGFSDSELFELSKIYRVGVDDVLFVTLNQGISKYLTVFNTGEIDVSPLDEKISVIGLTVDEIEKLLAGKLKDDESVTVEVTEYSSHIVLIDGAVKKPGVIYLEREAVPFATIISTFGLLPNAKAVIVTRDGQRVRKLMLSDAATDKFYLLPNDKVEFINALVKD